MEHAKIYTLLTYHGKKLQLSNAAIAFHLTEKLGYPVTADDLDRFLVSNRPANKVIVKTLVEEGLSQAEIVKHTGLAQSNVSYHMHSAGRPGYKNAYWMQYVEPKKPMLFATEHNTQRYPK